MSGIAIPTVSAAASLCGTPGSNGPVATLGGIVNTYYPPLASAAAGTTTITVGAANGAAQPIVSGDLLLVIQMQDAAIDSTNTAAYGGPVAGTTALNSTGLYEYALATSSVPTTGGVLTLAGTGAGTGLNNSYTVAPAIPAQGQRRYQVIRVPQYSSVTLTSSLAAAPWNGTTGGVLALDVAGVTNLGGATVSVDQMGFRAGLGRQLGGGPGGTGTDYRNLSSLQFHGDKGEGIAGSPAFMYDSLAAAAVPVGVEGYPAGSTARGAPGNAGGGGTDSNPGSNDQNTGGGGGGNGGQGGMGGNGWNTNRAVGGIGGRAFTAAAGQVVLGGGGGSGTRNNSGGIPNASSGGNGGGLVLLRTGSVSGAGVLSASGGVGVTPLNDGGGGGGAGGSVVVLAQTGGLGGLTIQARGGRGTDAWPTAAGAPAAHGPGGGGGGGAVFTSSSPSSVDVSGGANGTTTTSALSYGATPGAPGVAGTVTAAQLAGVSAGSACLPKLTVAKSTGTPAVVNTPAGTAATYTISVLNAAGSGTALAAVITDPLPSGFTYASTVAVTPAGGATRTSVSDPAAGATSPSWGVFSLPGGGSITITFTVAIAPSVVPGTYQNPAQTAYADPVRTAPTGTAQFSYDPLTSTAEDVTVSVPRPVADLGVTKAVDIPNPVVGTTLTFTIGIHNSGPAAVAAVSVSDPLPAGLSYQGSSASQGSYNPGTAIWSVGDLANGASATLKVMASVSQVGHIVNTAQVQPGAWLDPNAGNDSASAGVDADTLPAAPNTAGVANGAAPPAVPVEIGLLAAWLLGLACLGLAIGFVARRPGPGGHPRHGLPMLLAALAIYMLAAPVLPLAAERSGTSTTATGGLRPEIGDRQLFGKEISEVPPKPPAAVSHQVAAGPIVPARLRIPSLGLDVPIEEVGLTNTGAMDVPGNLWSAGWLKTGTLPGAAGHSVLDGHRNSAHGPGLFTNLAKLRAGDRIYVSDSAGGELTFEVTDSRSFQLSTFPRAEVFGPASGPELNLITCVGRYLTQAHTFDQRLVVFSRLLDRPPAA